MRAYELMVIIDGGLDETAARAQATTIEERLARLGIELPQAAAPVAAAVLAGPRRLLDRVRAPGDTAPSDLPGLVHPKH